MAGARTVCHTTGLRLGLEYRSGVSGGEGPLQADGHQPPIDNRELLYLLRTAQENTN
jgi:hypothetical protein